MTLAPETFLARELEMCYAPVCYLTNYAEGVMTREFVGGEFRTFKVAGPTNQADHRTLNTS